MPADEHVSRRQFLQSTALAAASVGLAGFQAAAADADEVKKTRSYNPDMEYRRLGKTGLWVSAVCLGGHWKRVDKVIQSKAGFRSCERMDKASEADFEAFYRNRADVVSRCIERGINLVDFAGALEPPVYARALAGRRDKMYVSWSMGAQEMRHPDHRKAKKLVEILEKGLKDTGLQYADCWRIMAHERGSRHPQAEVDEMVEALETARKKGLCRFGGFSTHDRKWAKTLIETYPDLMQMCCFPYTARSKKLPKDSFLDVVLKLNVGTLGIKPFASNAIFQGDGSPDGPHAAEDSRIARLTLRYILTNPAITAPIPGLASVQQVDNAAEAIRERRQQDLAADAAPTGRLHPDAQAELDDATDAMWANLGQGYEWLREWEYV
jgi:aryl-alcohol dehydrogenase-like predicted oxidoreductase